MWLMGTANDPDVLIIKGKHKLNKSDPNSKTIDRQCRYWAERGLIRVEDSLNNSYTVLSVREFMRHANAMSELLGNSRSVKTSGPDSDLRSEIQRIIDRSIELGKRAQIQGMPSDASAARDLRRRRPVSVVVPGGKAVM